MKLNKSQNISLDLLAKGTVQSVGNKVKSFEFVKDDYMKLKRKRNCSQKAELRFSRSCRSTELDQEKLEGTNPSSGNINILATPVFPRQETKESDKKQSIDELVVNFKNDNTVYDLTDRSDDNEDEDIDDNYDSKFFREVSVNNVKQKIKSVNGKKRIITLHKKCIAKWAENKDVIERILQYQNTEVVADLIFKPLLSDCISLSEVFEPKRGYEQRGSSANWKNEYWTPITEKLDRQQKGNFDFKIGRASCRERVYVRV